MEAWYELYAKAENDRILERIEEESRLSKEKIKGFENWLELNRGSISDGRTIKELSDLNGKTQQLVEESLSLITARCWCCRGCQLSPLSWSFWKEWFALFHIGHLTSQEIKQFTQRFVEIDKEINEEVRRAATADKKMADEETEREVDEARKNGGCVACHSENKNSIDNEQRVTLTSTEKQVNTEQLLITADQENQQERKETSKSNLPLSNSVLNNPKNEPSENNNSNQNNTNINKDALIAKLKSEIAELKKNLDPNNAKQKALLAQKEAQLAKLESKDEQNQGQTLRDKSKNPKENNLISVLLPIGIIFAVLLVASSMVWIAKKKKKFKKSKRK